MRLPALLLLLVLTACSTAEDPAGSADPPPASTPTRPTPTASSGSATSSPAPPAASPTASPTATRTPRPADPRWRFFTDDRTRWASPWYAGRHRVMIPFGCTPAPYYDADPTCPDGNGFHHGVDVAIPCGVALRAGRAATVVDHGALGPAYGVDPVLLRVTTPDGARDVVVGHTTRVFVAPGDPVARGEVFARVGDSAAPDGCHLHFEVRPAGGDYTSAVDPLPLLGLRG